MIQFRPHPEAGAKAAAKLYKNFGDGVSKFHHRFHSSINKSRSNPACADSLALSTSLEPPQSTPPHLPKIDIGLRCGCEEGGGGGGGGGGRRTAIFRKVGFVT
jgi:hypothetical protein